MCIPMPVVFIKKSITTQVSICLQSCRNLTIVGSTQNNNHLPPVQCLFSYTCCIDCINMSNIKQTYIYQSSHLKRAVKHQAGTYDCKLL